MRGELRLNAFAMNCVGHQAQGLWRHPRDRSTEYRTLNYWVELAQLLERGRFDALFLADVVGVYDVYEGRPDTALREGVQAPVNDPLLIIPSMAQATEHLGFAVTCNLSHEPPLPFARRMTTLDHLTGGRIGWNVVTGYLDSGAKGAGRAGQVSHDVRYDIAEEFMQIQYGFWEGSWEDGAVLRDRSAGVFTDPGKVHRVQVDGKYFTVDAVHICEPSPQRTPVIYQAGSSAKGTAFAARHAECVFIGGNTPAKMAEEVSRIRDMAVQNGRSRDDVLVFALATVVTAATDEEAEAKFAEYQSYVSETGTLAMMSGWAGVDLSRPNEARTGAAGSNAIQSVAANLAGSSGSTERRVGRPVGLGGGGPAIVGGPARVADELVAWAEEADLDGFNLAYVVMPETFFDIVEYLVPELQRRGLYKQDYAPGAYREKLFGEGPRLGVGHPGAQYRHP